MIEVVVALVLIIGSLLGIVIGAFGRAVYRYVCEAAELADQHQVAEKLQAADQAIAEEHRQALRAMNEAAGKSYRNLVI